MGTDPPPVNQTRIKPRIGLEAEAIARRAGSPNYRVRIRDLSQAGCKLEIVDRPRVGERIWVKVEGLEALEATVRWVKNGLAGARFVRPLHPAVFDLLVQRLNSPPDRPPANHWLGA